jgi:bifunctional non-homologous end joining protein LigD
MPLTRRGEPFDDPDWIFEAKMDGFRAVAYVEADACRLVSRHGKEFRTFATLAAAIGRDLVGRTVILDGEIVHPGPDGRPLFYELVRSRGHGPFAFYAFDLVWLDGGDLREQPLLERKRALRKLVPLEPRAVRYVEHVASGTELFRAICELDMEGIVAKQAAGLYTPEATTWVKIKNPAYSQAVGRSDFFERRTQLW